MDASRSVDSQHQGDRVQWKWLGPWSARTAVEIPLAHLDLVCRQYETRQAVHIDDLYQSE